MSQIKMGGVGKGFISKLKKCLLVSSVPRLTESRNIDDIHCEKEEEGK
jgi:hypothetical protein